VSGSPRVLVIAQGGHADGLRAVPFVRAVRRRHPGSRITVLGYQLLRDLWESCPYVDAFVAAGRDVILGIGWRARAAKLRRALRLAPRLVGRYDVLLNLSVQPEGGSAAALGILARIPTRIGHGGQLQGMNRSPGRADMRVPYEHRAAALLRLLGVEEVDPALEAWCSEDDRRSVARLLDAAGHRPGRPLVVCHAGSDWSCQRWPARRWAELAGRLATRDGALVVLSGTAAESAQTAEIAAAAGGRAVDLAGRTSFGQLCALLARADLLVSVDTLVAPLARAMGAPVTTLMTYDTSNWSAERMAEIGALTRFEVTEPPPWSVRCQWTRSGRLRGCESDSCVGVHGMGRIRPEDVLALPALRGGVRPRPRDAS
jgi:ADP-heptose:LPS heptosyltransferase